MGRSTPSPLSVSCTHLGQKRGALGGSSSLVGPVGVLWDAANWPESGEPAWESPHSFPRAPRPRGSSTNSWGAGSLALAPRAREQAVWLLTPVPSRQDAGSLFAPQARIQAQGPGTLRPGRARAVQWGPPLRPRP